MNLKRLQSQLIPSHQPRFSAKPDLLQPSHMLKPKHQLQPQPQLQLQLQPQLQPSQELSPPGQVASQYLRSINPRARIQIRPATGTQLIITISGMDTIVTAPFIMP